MSFLLHTAKYPHYKCGWEGTLRRCEHWFQAFFGVLPDSAGGEALEAEGEAQWSHLDKDLTPEEAYDLVNGVEEP